MREIWFDEFGPDEPDGSLGELKRIKAVVLEDGEVVAKRVDCYSNPDMQPPYCKVFGSCPINRNDDCEFLVEVKP